MSAPRILRHEGDGARLVLTLHGPRHDATQFHDAAATLVPGAHVLSPEGTACEDGRRYFTDDLAARVSDLADLLADEVASTGATQVFVIGYDAGADMALALAAARPDLVDVLALLHPTATPPAMEVSGLAETRVLITSGRDDPEVSTTQIEALAAWMNLQKADVIVAWHPEGRKIPQSEVEALADFLV